MDFVHPHYVKSPFSFMAFRVPVEQLEPLLRDRAAGFLLVRKAAAFPFDGGSWQTWLGRLLYCQTVPSWMGVSCHANQRNTTHFVLHSNEPPMWVHLFSFVSSDRSQRETTGFSF